MRYRRTDLVQISIRVPKIYAKAVEKNARRTNRYKVAVIVAGLDKELDPKDFGNVENKN